MTGFEIYAVHIRYMRCILDTCSAYELHVVCRKYMWAVAILSVVLLTCFANLQVSNAMGKFVELENLKKMFFL